ncbi:dihydroneopterin triphosphate diphosphatase [Paraglaciecola aquimarina]|uniref:Dihydroneopterin triphosphate diphosphatase n=1 Tax=Paraglaciecola aquimarina TaxID=1235557 RepID=A0ABU3T1C3_9ALTE|nr:dihydroneopterin triphosphate diphosphatase [Paraglaciecola aquimarina]MDU0356071.1 dihydroneopterin triphosphate diphosphatase [Paraglaciecola aquimarina]
MTARYRIPKSALTVVYNQTGQVLVMQRNDDPEFWQSVTGTLEPDEKPRDTAMREVFEETGIDIAKRGYRLQDCQQVNTYEIRDMWKHRYPPNTPFNTEYVFAVEVADNEVVTLTEHSAYVWLDKTAAMQKVWSETNRQAIELYVPDAM